MNKTIQSVCFAGAFLALATPGSAQAQRSPVSIAGTAAGRALAEAGCAQHRCGASLGAQFDHADLVFEGVVRSVESRLSDASADGAAPRLPVTFVTFEVGEVFWGVVPQRDPGRITIRILGGASPDGRVLSVSGRPLFAVGQRDILMVRSNHRGVASVLHGSNRRFRLRGDEVFSESGREILASPGGELFPGALQDVPEFRRVRIGGQVIEQVVHDTEGEQPGVGAGVRLDAADFRSLLRLMARGASPAKLERTRLVDDVSMADSFVLAPGLGREAPAAKQAVGEEMPASERLEREAEERK